MAIETAPLPSQNGPAILSRGRRFQKHGIGQEILAQGFGIFPYAPPNSLVDDIMEGWNDFLNQVPPEEKERWGKVGDPRDFDDGFVVRHPEKVNPNAAPEALPHNGKFDNKYWLHYRPHLPQLLEIHNINFEKQRKFLRNLNTFWYYNFAQYQKVLTALDDALPGYNFVRRGMNNVANTKHVIRLLSYRSKLVPGVCLASKHPDRNFGTWHAYETDPRLRLFLNEEGEMEYRPIPDHALFFTGTKAQQLTKGRLKALEHDVIVPAKVNDPNKLRQSIVVFQHIYPELMP